MKNKCSNALIHIRNNEIDSVTRTNTKKKSTCNKGIPLTNVVIPCFQRNNKERTKAGQTGVLNEASNSEVQTAR